MLIRMYMRTMFGNKRLGCYGKELHLVVIYKAITLEIMMIEVPYSNSGRRIVETTLVSYFEPNCFFERV